MLTSLFAWVGARVRPHFEVLPWGSGYGLARTLLAVATAGTLIATAPDVLLSPLANGVVPPTCHGLTQAGVWCAVPAGHGQAARWLSIAILAVVASGWRPRFTAPAHWWVSWSLIANVTVQDGGDQITAVLTLLLLPLALTDRRRWHWQPAPSSPVNTGRVAAHAAIVLVQIQMSLLYFQASVAKLGVPEWADGTAMYYWLRHPTFGTASWLRPLTDAVTGSPFGVAAITWASVGLELSLAAAILLRPGARRVLLRAGIAFHAAIALCMGLLSFGVAMSAGLLLYLLPAGHMIRLRPFWLRTVDSRVVAASGAD
jgi:antimicrobial peptide system SdpB family protein